MVPSRAGLAPDREDQRAGIPEPVLMLEPRGLDAQHRALDLASAGLAVLDITARQEPGALGLLVSMGPAVFTRRIVAEHQLSIRDGEENCADWHETSNPEGGRGCPFRMQSI
jgi:hypothetical protein